MALRGAEFLAFTAANAAPARAPAGSSPPASHQVATLAAAPQTSSAGTTTTLLAGAVAGLAALTVSSRSTGGRRSSSSAVSRAAVAVSVGQRVSWKGLTGTVQHSGAVDFAAGEWVGIALDQPSGLHDGTVLGKSYFTCAPKHGIFCQAADVEAAGAGAPAAAAPAMAAAAAPAPAAAGAAVSVGQTVTWKGQSGTVKYVGKVGFGSGEWVGIQLDQPNGMHEGKLFDVEYFSCPPKTGVFCSAADLGGAAPAPAPAAVPATAAPAAAPAPAGGSFAVGSRVMWNGNAGTVHYVGAVDFGAGEWVGVVLDQPKGMHDGSLFGKTYFSCGDKCGVFSQASSLQAA
eukprot:CAMPEP_0178424224 /NCGR_PEP_ID=MMETSP0689_2-20121128/28099_1 /TAXON_ID=160604 /ORGANISM="Amphidinium massartii, Strain CS-259" /LENGTH=343 /DNA_ID=CAMNT_0020045853 /DNA_START=56 /DNA_END=1087 /DNA_ORIENTATION=+